MKKQVRYFVYFIPLLVFLGITLFLWRGLSHDPSEIPSPFINKPLPKFHAQTLFQSNNALSNQQFLGHISLLNVWATWCISCRAEHPILMEIAQSKEVALYGLDYKDDRKMAKQWLAKYGNPYQIIAFDPTGQLGIDLGVYGTPETFIIDQKGFVRFKYVGPISPTVWQDELLPKIKQLQNHVS